MIQVSVCKSQSKLHSVHPPPYFAGGGGLSLQPNFKKKGLEGTSIFRGGLLGKRCKTFSGGRVHLSHNNLKSEIFNHKKSL